jgi:hypothetical protein
MRKSTCNELAALLAQLKRSTERANASLDATLRYLDEGKSGQIELDQAARTRALIEFESTDFAAISDAMGLTHYTDGVD